MSSSAPTIASAATLAEVEQVVRQWCDATDPACHTGGDAVAAVERLARVIRRLTAKQAGFAERVDACRAQPRQARSPDDWLARQNGTSVGDARKAIDTARRLKQCPATADAFANGDLSLGEADAISGAAAVDPAAEAALVAKAKQSHDLADTRARAAKVKAAARNESAADPEATVAGHAPVVRVPRQRDACGRGAVPPRRVRHRGTGDRRVRQADLRPGPRRRHPRLVRGLPGRRRARRPRRCRPTRRSRPRHPHTTRHGDRHRRSDLAGEYT